MLFSGPLHLRADVHRLSVQREGFVMSGMVSYNWARFNFVQREVRREVMYG